MLSSITPLGERGRGNSWASVVTLYILASTLGGATTGALAGLAGAGLEAILEPSEVAVAVALVVLGVAGFALDLQIARLPAWRRQVNEDWLTMYRGWVYAIGFGFQLGMAFMTIVVSSSVYVTFLLAVLTGSVMAGVAIGATFGLARGVMILSVARVNDTAELRSFHRRLQETAPAVRRATIGAELGLAIAAAASIPAAG